jgi:hypothetical protein
MREDKDSVGHRLLNVPGYTFRIWVTNRSEPPEEFWRDYNQRATIEQRIEKVKNDLHDGGFCAKAFDTAKAAFLGTSSPTICWRYIRRTSPRRMAGGRPRNSEPPSSPAEKCWGGRGANWCSVSPKTEVASRSSTP